MTRTILTALVLTLALATPAAATVMAGATPLQQQWLAESQLPQPNIAITVQDRECSEYEASACYKPSRSLMVMDDYADMLEGDAFSEVDRRNSKLLFWHELGHATDFRLDRPKSAKYRYRLMFGRIMRYRGTTADTDGEWMAPFGGYDMAEQFAQAYAYCANDRYWLDPTLLTDFPGYEYEPTQAQHKRVCRLLAKWL